MLDLDTRTALLRLHREGHGTRAIARALGITKNTVKRVLRQGVVEAPSVEREEKAEPYLEQILELHQRCKGNLVRVWEELGASGVTLTYSTLTGFCRRRGIGVQEPTRAGQYHFEAGEEMQHDTSPHDVTVGGKQRRLQCASVVLCFSRMLYAQVYPTFNRFYCKVFLSEALQYFGGAAGRCMLDNSNVVIACGTGKNALVAPEMKAFGDRFGFTFAAHEKGDANRSARVERPFDYIENNFYTGRSFADLEDLNRQLIEWCGKANGSFKKHLQTRPVELFQNERARLRPLPIHVPEVYVLHQRIVDLEGYVHVHTNRYSAPAEQIGRRVEVRESKDRVRIFDGHRVVAEHRRLEEKSYARSTLPEHTQRGLWRRKRGNFRPELPEEQVLKAAGPELSALMAALQKKHDNRAAGFIRRLYRMYLDYPNEVLQKAVEEALQYGLLDLTRIERMVLRYVAGDFFRLSLNNQQPLIPKEGENDGGKDH